MMECSCKEQKISSADKKSQLNNGSVLAYLFFAKEILVSLYLPRVKYIITGYRVVYMMAPKKINKNNYKIKNPSNNIILNVKIPTNN